MRVVGIFCVGGIPLIDQLGPPWLPAAPFFPNIQQSNHTSAGRVKSAKLS